MSDRISAAAADRRTPGPHPQVTMRLVLMLLLCAVVIGGVAVLVGLGLTHAAGSGSRLSGDLRVDRWLADRRTSTFNGLTGVGSELGNTEVVIAVAFVAFFALRLWLGRWWESALLVLAVSGQALIFVTITALVHRHRPPVPHLDHSPPTSSFPSGHTSASVALYGFLAVMLWRYARSQVLAVLTTAVLILVPFAVAGSRLYRGMHYPSDVLAGAIASGLWLACVIHLLLPRSEATAEPVAQRAPIRVVQEPVERSSPRA